MSGDTKVSKEMADSNQNTEVATSEVEHDTEKQEKNNDSNVVLEKGTGLHYVLTKTGSKKVSFIEGDPENPRNWSKGKKWYLTILCSYINVLAASQASVYSTGQTQIQEEFGISKELAIAGLSLYVLGFAIGPMVVAPLSEEFGRRRVYVFCWAVFVLLQFGVAFAPNVPVLFIFRFLTGCFSSPPLANTGGVVSDLWARDQSGPAMAVYVLGSCMGPQIGNIYAGFIAQKLGWRWVFYLTSLLILGLHWFLLYFTLSETRHNILLERKAARLRKDTGDDSYVSFDEDEKKPMSQLLKTSLSRPFIFLATEPITLFAAICNLHYVIRKQGTKRVQFVEADPENPRNWSNGKKWYLTVLCSYINVLVASQASVYATGQAQVIEEFGISEELAIAGLSLYGRLGIFC